MRNEEKMKIIFRSICIILFAVLAVSCKKYGEAPYSYSGPAKKKQCIMRCHSRHHECKRSCTNTAPKCHRKAYTKTKVAFERYVDQQEIAGKPVNRDFNSFNDPLQCKKITCDCADDYALCRRVCSTKSYV